MRWILWRAAAARCYREKNTPDRFTNRGDVYKRQVLTFPADADTGVEARGRSVKAMRRRALEQWKKDMKGRIHHGTQKDAEQA